MAGKVKPVNVAPVIKCARYSFLILGFFYGNLRMSGLRMYESKARVLRHKMLHDKKHMEKQRVKELSSRELMDFALQCDVTEFPPGWDDDL